ncbi:MAG TPA: cyclic nucleotide-binding domain-containing protein [Candidatus Limnocylindrales bacterium]|nr:cyclic nucleotide-binding domain-containing protein [Candidatus Limnocylindrales bacterium]
MPSPSGPWPIIRRVLASRSLRRVLPAYLLFNAAEYGTWVAMLLYAHERTGPASVGLVALVQLVPAAIVAPAAAGLGDRFPRERILAAGYLVQAVAVLATSAAMAAAAPVLVVYGVAAAAASSFVVTRPTQSALLPALARTPDELSAGNATVGVVEGAGVLLGPLVAAAILAGSTPAAVFLVGGGGLIVAAVSTFGLRPIGGLAAIADDGEGAGGAGMAGSPDDGLLAGLSMVVGDRDARLVVGLLTACFLMIGSADVLFVLLALDRLGIGDSGAGVLAAALGAGSVVGGGLAFGLIGRQRVAVVAIGGSLAWAAALATVGLTASAIVAPWLIVVGGAGLAIVNIAGRTLLQRSIRDEILARVFGLQEGLAMAGLALGSILVPVAVGAFGLVGATVALAVAMPVFVAIVWPALTDLDRRALVPVAQLALFRRTPVFGALPGPQLEAIARRATWLTVPAGTTVIREGDAGDRFYVLADGELEVSRAGRPIRSLTAAGEGFGEIALLRGVPRTATVTTTADSTLLAIDRAPFLAAITGHPDAFAAAHREAARRSM